LARVLTPRIGPSTGLLFPSVGQRIKATKDNESQRKATELLDPSRVTIWGYIDAARTRKNLATPTMVDSQGRRLEVTCPIPLTAPEGNGGDGQEEAQEHAQEEAGGTTT
jgi:hypothetical protein